VTINHAFCPIYGQFFFVNCFELEGEIRQWSVLSKFSKKYENFKKKQKDIDEKLDEENID
jgi:hypothetical protein